MTSVKKRSLAVIMMILMLFLWTIPLIPKSALANSAMPAENSTGTGVVFEKYNEVKVVSEVLNIKFNSNRIAEIEANYKMKNLTDKALSVQTMFISPVSKGELSKTYENDYVDFNALFQVKQDNIDIKFTEEIYKVNRNAEVGIEDWQYIIENPSDENRPMEASVSAVSYQMQFDPGEEIDITVAYSYYLGGNVSYVTDFRLLYYLTPAKYWDSFSDLTINLTLDDEHPRLDKKSTSVQFKKVDKNTYQFKTDSLPNEELKIVAREPWLNEVAFNLFNPFSVVIIWLPVIAVGLIVFVVVLIVKRAKKLKDQQGKIDL